jgi:hypothetical protein
MKSKLKASILLVLAILLFFSCSKKNNPPSIQNQEFTVPEYSDQGTFVGKVLATDEDNDTTLTFAILSGNQNNAFLISSATGEITVSNEVAMNFEATPSFTLTVEVRDSHNATAVATVTVNLQNLVPPTNGLLVYYPFNGNVSDSSGNADDCINYTSGNFVPGRWGMGLDFNGTSDYLQLEYPLNSALGLSFSFWIKSRGANGIENHGAIVAKYNMTSQQRCFMIYSFGANETRADNRLSAAFYAYATSSAYHDHTKSYLEPAELLIYPTDPSYWTISNPKRLVPGSWTHCIVNMTPTALEIWLDGVMCTKKTREYTSYNDSASEPVYIGNNVAIGDGSNNHFNGILDELRIYNRGLTTSEIKALFRER